MKYYLAPMEGITTYIFRKNIHKFFTPADKYFTPFVSNTNLSSKERNEIIPEHNEGLNLVPQILANRSEDFLAMANVLGYYGYDTVNLNLGCPSGTVVARKRGSGFLGEREMLLHFLDEIFEKCPLKISVKTRIGLSDLSEWEEILKIYQRFPMDELIIHPRLQKEMYNGHVHLEAYKMAQDMIFMPLCYNGDITSVESFDEITSQINTDAVMIGRGILKDPFLFNRLKGQEIPDKKRLKEFHDAMLEDYQSIMYGDTNTLYKMKDVWTFLGPGLGADEKVLKKIKKSKNIAEYKTYVREILS